MYICFPHSPAYGGPGTFQSRFEKKLTEFNCNICYKKDNIKPDVVLVIGGTRHILWLFKMKNTGIPIILRLDGIGWLHKKKKVSLKNYLTTEVQNLTSKIIHSFIADKIIYQSKFSETWWNRNGFRKRKNVSIIYNGATDIFFNTNNVFNLRKRLLILEGHIDYSPYAIRLLNDLAATLSDSIEIEVYGKFENNRNLSKLSNKIQYKGFIESREIPDIMKGSVFLSLDINPACPNSVIEALACGVPVVAFDTGSLSELISDDSGIVVPYGSNPWDLEYPDVKSLIKAIYACFDRYEFYSENAKATAKKRFNINDIFNQYMTEINKCVQVL